MRNLRMLILGVALVFGSITAFAVAGQPDRRLDLPAFSSILTDPRNCITCLVTVYSVYIVGTGINTVSAGFDQVSAGFDQTVRIFESKES